MSNKIGRFEILSELAKSDSGCVYKASDPESGQVLALKTIRLEAFGEHAGDIEQRILAEAETTKDLTSPNLTLVYGAGEIDGQFCAAMEYVQGNSIATMLARKEGFSIWDLLDISRQVCQGLDHAHEHGVFHLSLEPAKVMVTWDGTVKILSFGISSTGYVHAQAQGEPPSVLYYMSPEQVSGEALDGRSNLFSWGAMLYEMVTDQKAFGAADANGVRQRILEETPLAPAQVNPKINAIASAVIMKALAKDPAQRYQSGKELAAELDKCREMATKATKAVAPKAAPVAPKPAAPAAASKFASPVAKTEAPVEKPATAAPPAPRFSSQASLADELETSWTPPTPAPVKAPPPKPNVEEAPKAASAAAGWNGGSASRGPTLDPSAQFISATVRASVDALSREGASLSAGASVEPAVERPKIAVDPMMAEPSEGAAKTTSFSELSELPPLKEVYIAPPPPKPAETAVDPTLPSVVFRPSEPEKPKVDPREVAEKAIKEIKGVPPKLMIYSLGGAVAIILVVGAAMAWHSYSQNTDEEGSVPAKPVAAATQAAPAAAQESPSQAPPPAATPETQSAQQDSSAAAAESEAPSKTAAKNVAKARPAKGKKSSAPAPVLAIVPGQLTVDSNPEGAQIQLDGRGDPNWVTPFNLPSLAPGSHTVVISKSGYGQETRTVDVVASSKASLNIRLTQLNAVMSVSSDPAGASIIVDGKDTQKVTPSQISLENGNHTILVRKSGYLDETTSAIGQPGQSFHFAPTLRALGSVDDIKTVGKFKKLFGGGAVLAGMGKVSVRTLPKGAQIAVNRRMLEKPSPVDFLLNPGNYVVDITETGYKPVQKVITVEKDGSVSIDETLQPQ